MKTFDFTVIIFYYIALRSKNDDVYDNILPIFIIHGMSIGQSQDWCFATTAQDLVCLLYLKLMFNIIEGY